MAITGLSMSNIVILASLWIIPQVASHGRLLEPPSRPSMWRQGYSTPINYNDNQLFCGGFKRQWETNKGKCGICGDPWDGPREETRIHEAGGQYATGLISKTYEEGSLIPIKIQLTAHHKGWFEIRICPNNDVNTPATKECLDRHLLAQNNGNTRYEATMKKQIYEFHVKLPDDLICTQCVLQWRYHTGNSWGTDPDTGRGCVGCGPQEEFYSCADVAITPKVGAGAPSTSTSPTTSSTSPSSTPSTTTSTPTPAPATPDPTAATSCTAGPGWENIPGMAAWCQQDCANHCKNNRCSCPGDPPKKCDVVAPYSDTPAMVTWCLQQCPGLNCLPTHCNCHQEINGQWVPLR